MDNSIIEVVLFKAAPNVTDAQIATAAQALAPALAGRDGFIRRELAHDGAQWVDIVHWCDLPRRTPRARRSWRYRSVSASSP